MTGAGSEGKMKRSPEYLAGKVKEIIQNRSQATPIEVAVSGYSTIKQHALTHDYELAGATWWLESLSDERGSLVDMLNRVKEGPTL